MLTLKLYVKIVAKRLNIFSEDVKPRAVRVSDLLSDGRMFKPHQDHF